ncbi:MAG: hypothetical protein Fur0018_00460 [Anaerolineales bacterium]
MKYNPLLWGIVIMAAALLAFMPLAVQAQDTLRARLTLPDTGAFPEIQTYLTLRTADGQPLAPLTHAGLRLLEDGLEVPDFSLEHIHPGLQLVVSVNPAGDFGIRDSQGVTRYAFLQAALTSWAQMAPQGDDISLIIAGGREYLHTASPQAWIAGLDIGDPHTASPNYEVLSHALDVVSEAAPRPAMGRAVLLITPLPSADVVNSLQSVVARAGQQDVALFFWVVTSSSNFDLAQSRQLRALAAQTGGQVFFFSGNETIPPLDAWLAPLRDAYRIGYTSQIRSGETHTLQAVITSGGISHTVDAPSFRYLILPPNPIFIQPPFEIQRIAPMTVNTAASQTLAFTPDSQEIEILADFPDEHPRPLQLARLYVDGKLVAENTTPPVTRFVWDLNETGGAGAHRLQAEVVDVLGLRGMSNDAFVTVRVIIPTPSIGDVVRERLPLALGLGTAVIILLTLWLLLLSGRFRPPETLTGRTRRSLPDMTWSTHRPARPVHGGTAHLGQLNPLSQNGHRSTPIRLVSEDIVLGSDPSQATIVIAHPSISAAHARLKHLPNGGFRLYDLQSAAGTWCNFAPVSPDGQAIRHGDVLHIGALAFQLEIPGAAPRTVTIQPTEKTAK